LLFRAARELSIDLENSWFIGDTMDDMEAGRSAGCRTMLLNRGNESQWIISATRNPEFIVDNWREATRTILATPQHAEGVAV
jgi:phosphoglycolate phosphatase-like HAD superfamily hydrolase